MRLVTRDTDYAISALCELAKDTQAPRTARHLSETLAIPYSFLRQILQTLAQSGLVRSQKGRSGGFQLACEPHEIEIGSLLETFQGPIAFTHCVTNDAPCPRLPRCKLSKKLRSFQERFESEIGGLRISDLLDT